MKMKLKEKDIRIGDTIQIQRAGDVIPQVVSVDISKEKKRVLNLFFQINACVVLQQLKKLAKVQKARCCKRCLKGYDCEFTAREKLKHFVSKEALNRGIR